jgi:hypothetical protein
LNDDTDGSRSTEVGYGNVSCLTVRKICLTATIAERCLRPYTLNKLQRHVKIWCPVGTSFKNNREDDDDDAKKQQEDRLQRVAYTIRLY